MSPEEREFCRRKAVEFVVAAVVLGTAIFGGVAVGHLIRTVFP